MDSFSQTPLLFLWSAAAGADLSLLALHLAEPSVCVVEDLFPKLKYVFLLILEIESFYG